MNSQNGSRYLRIPQSIWFRILINYTEKEKKKIISFFPTDKREAALKETTDHVSTLISWLGSAITPTNIKRKESVHRIKALRDQLQSLENQLQFFLQEYAHQNTIELKRRFYSLIYPEYPQITLPILNVLISRLKSACREVIKSPGKPGGKNPAYYEVVGNLAEVWKKYKGKEPTLHNIVYALPESKEGQSQKPGGPFLDYLEISIGSAIWHVNKNRKEKIGLDVSLANIARDVIRKRKKFMAKISSK